jgi:hypothetical protein
VNIFRRLFRRKPKQMGGPVNNYNLVINSAPATNPDIDFAVMRAMAGSTEHIAKWSGESFSGTFCEPYGNAKARDIEPEPEQPKPARREWRCNHCQQVNLDTNLDCRACGAPKP